MKHIRLIWMLVVAVAFMACGDNEEERIYTIDDLVGVYNGQFVERVAGADYATATLNVEITKTGANTISLAIDDFQASPGDPATGRPATMMSNTVVRNVRVENVGNGQFRLVCDELEARGDYGTTPFDFEGTFEGTWSFGVTQFTMSFQMGRMPYPVEATFIGTK
ncbi:MAG: hypothetical protein IJ816_03340 [Alloprevotella sp.]|nr:hypothetical protein [Alloprevotella sp.]